MKWEYEQLHGNLYVVRPQASIGTCGWIDGKPWSVKFVTGLNKAIRLVNDLNKEAP